MTVVTAAETVELRFDDPARALRALRLAPEWGDRSDRPAFLRDEDSGVWSLRFARPPVDRLEYRLELTHGDGTVEVVCDPTNPLFVDDPPWERSVLELPSYRPPAWLARAAPAGEVETTELATARLGAAVEGVLWSAARTDGRARLPLLVVHDGLDYRDHAALTHLLDDAIHRGEMPPVRAALLAPIQRFRDYVASEDYADALADELMPSLSARLPTTTRIGVGTSLGALALLHAHTRYPDLFDALFLQSGSFFQPAHGAIGTFPTVTSFVDQIRRAATAVAPIPVVLTCGTAEQNLDNNRAMCDALAAQGYPVELHEHRDAHNWTSWRDSLSPHLPRLLVRMSS